MPAALAIASKPQRGNAPPGTSPAAALLLTGSVCLLALPSAILGFSSRFDPQQVAAPARGGASEFIPAEVDPRLSRSIAVRALSKGRTFRFTPAASASHLERSVTVAVRLDSGAGRPIVVRGARQKGDLALGGSVPIAPTGYSLGAARGYKSFAHRASEAATDNAELAQLPDLAAFRPSPGARPDTSRFSPRIALDGHDKAGRSPRTFEGQPDKTVDLGGAYSVTRNLDVTAGVRYSSQRDRLAPLTDGRNDSQAVYVGTQFRF